MYYSQYMYLLQVYTCMCTCGTDTTAVHVWESLHTCKFYCSTYGIGTYAIDAVRIQIHRIGATTCSGIGAYTMCTKREMVRVQQIEARDGTTKLIAWYGMVHSIVV